MTTKYKDIRRSVHDFDKEYREGAHWDTDVPSATTHHFIELLPKGAYILDDGCGAGRDVIFFAKQGFKVMGIDISPEGIKLARKRSHGLQNVDFKVAAGEDLPFLLDRWR